MSTAPEIEPSRPKFDELAEQFSIVANSYKVAQSKDQQRRLLDLMRVIIDKVDSLQKFYSAKLSE